MDDGSPDNCPVMCDAWAQRDVRIKVIHKKNGGLSEARNSGITVSNGRYLAFVYSDYYVDERFVECLYTQIRENGAQISCVGLQNFSDKDSVNIDTEQHRTILYQRKEAVVTLFDESKFGNYAWNKLYDRK